MCQFRDGIRQYFQPEVYQGIRRTLDVVLRKNCNLLILCILLLSTRAFANEKLDPFTAEFTVLPGTSGADIAVVLDFTIHNGKQEKLLGSKFICMEDLESVNVTDDEGKKLPFTIKKYPRKRIIWEYAAAKQGRRRTKIHFIMKDAVKQQGDTLEINIDWIGGWKRQVFNADYTIVLPGDITQKDIISVYPGQYRFDQAEGRTKIAYQFPELTTKALKVVLKHENFVTDVVQDRKDTSKVETKTATAKNEIRETQHALNEKPAQKEIQAGKTDNTTKLTRKADILQEVHEEDQKTVTQAQQAEKDEDRPENESKAVITPAPGGPYVLKKIRYAPYDDLTDRIVFDFNRPIPYSVTYNEKKDEVAIVLKGPVSVASKAGKKNSITSKFIKGLYWEKDKNKKLSCMLQLNRKNMKVRYGTLKNPPRIYLDLFQKKVQTAVQHDKIVPAKKSTTPAVKQKSAALQKPVIQEQVLAAGTAPTTTTTAIAVSRQEAPIEEKIAYRKSKKFFKLGNYLKAVTAYREFLRRYPQSVLREKIFFEIAESYFKMAEEEEPKYYTYAIDAYKTAIANFPQSRFAPQAAFQIAESNRKRNLFIEAKSQYLLVAKKYPQSPSAVAAHFWIAECLYQMKNYTEALKQFLQYVEDYISGPYHKEATYRIGDCYFQVKDFDRAEFYYEKAIKRWPDLSMVPVESLNNLATTDYYQGNFERCREAFFLSYNLYPSQDSKERLLRFIGDSYQWEGEMQKALNIYGLLVRFAPDSYEAMIGAMRIADIGVNVEGLNAKDFIFHNMNPYHEPETLYRWVVDNDNRGDMLTEAFYKLGFIVAKKGAYPEAVALFKRAMYQKEKGIYYNKAYDNVQKILVKMINSASQKYDHFSVVELYKRHEKVFLGSIDECDFLYNVALGYLETGLLRDAESIFERVVAQQGNSACKQSAVVCLGRIDVSRGNLQKAEDRLKILLFGRNSRIEPGVAEKAYHVLGDIYYLDQRYQKAVEAYAIPLREKQHSYRFAKSLFRLGVSFGKIGYHYNGIQAFKRMMALQEKVQTRKAELHSFVEEARMLIGDYLFDKGNYGTARMMYQDIVQTTSDRNKKGWALVKWGETYLKTGNQQEAIRVFNDVLDKMPYSFLARFAQARIDEIKWQNRLQPELQHVM